jgi:hypothetical protein
MRRQFAGFVLPVRILAGFRHWSRLPLAFWLLAPLLVLNLSAGPPTHCLTAPVRTMSVEELRPLVEASAARHPIEGFSQRVMTDWMLAILAVESGPPVQGEPPAFHALVYPAWQTAKALSACGGLDTTIGIAQVRPRTAAELMEGRLEHAGYRLAHDITPAYDVRGEGVLGINVARLAQPDVSIEYLAANLALGAKVGQIFGATPTLEDLARWHNTGLGSWNRATAPPALWKKGSLYVHRVCQQAGYTCPYEQP